MSLSYYVRRTKEGVVGRLGPQTSHIPQFSKVFGGVGSGPPLRHYWREVIDLEWNKNTDREVTPDRTLRTTLRTERVTDVQDRSLGQEHTVPEGRRPRGRGDVVVVWRGHRWRGEDLTIDKRCTRTGRRTGGPTFSRPRTKLNKNLRKWTQDEKKLLSWGPKTRPSVCISVGPSGKDFVTSGLEDGESLIELELKETTRRNHGRSLHPRVPTIV